LLAIFPTNPVYQGSLFFLVLLDYLLQIINKGGSHCSSLERNMGKWKCLWCSKVLEGESFMDLVEASMKEEGGQHVHGWKNITLVKESVVLENKLVPV